MVADAYAAEAKPVMNDVVRKALGGWMAGGGRFAREVRQGKVLVEALNEDLDSYESWARRHGPRVTYLDVEAGLVLMV